MENNGDQPNEKKLINKARSYNNTPPLRLKSEPAKRKSFNVNEAVRSLDLALGRLKKSKLVNGEYTTSRQINPTTQEATDMFMDMCTSSNFNQGTENASLMSMNFSHYELMRNVSRSNCNSDGAFSGNTCSTHLIPADLNVKDEHLEKYFRSIEMWSRNYRDGGTSSLHLELPEK